MTAETNNLTDIISAYQAKDYHISLVGQLKSGKEATVYAVRDNDKVFALKVYADPERRDFSDNKAYLAGKWYRKASVRKAVSQGNNFAKAFLHKSWVRHEFYLLQKLFNAGAAVPRVYDWTPDSILMEFIGDNLVSAPRLIDVTLTRDQATTALGVMLINIDIMLEAGVVHSDLSAYNILWWKERPYVIDFPQAVDVRSNPNTESLLRRDIRNVVDYFGQFCEIDEPSVYARFGLSEE